MSTQLYRLLLATDLLGVSYQYLNDSLEALRKGFEGPTEPPSPVPYQVWYDTATGLKKERNAANDAWIVMGKIGVAEEGHLPTTGGTLSGDLNMGGRVITSLGVGTGASAARVQELDLKAPIAGPVFTGDAKVSQDPVGNDSIPRRSWTEGRYAKLAGATMTGALDLVGDAPLSGADLRAIPFRQLRDFVSFNLTAGHRHTGGDARKILGTDLDSAAQALGNMLRANGTGGVTWANPNLQTAFSKDPPVLVVNAVALTSTWQTVDVSASVPAGTYMAHLRVFLDDAGAGTTLRFRKNGSSQDVAAQSWGPFFASDFFFWMEIEVDSSKLFQWRAPAGSGNLSVWLMGYDITMF